MIRSDARPLPALGGSRTAVKRMGVVWLVIEAVLPGRDLSGCPCNFTKCLSFPDGSAEGAS